MVSTKRRIKTGRSGKKYLPDYLTRWKIILSLLSHGESSLQVYNALKKRWDLSRPLFSQDIHRMMYEGWLHDLNPNTNKYKYYKVTDSGCTVLAGWEKGEKIKLAKIENSRHVCKIRNDNNLDNFLSKEQYRFERIKTLNNVKTYYGYVEGMQIGVYIGNETTLVITPQPFYARDLMTGHHKIHQTMLDFCNLLNRKWLFDLTIPEPTSHRQYTFSDKFSNQMMKLSGGSQIKFHTKDGLVDINQSRQTEPRIEFESLEKAQEYIEVPDQIKLMMDKLDTIENKEKARDEILNRVVNAVGKNSESIDKLANLFNEKLSSKDEIIKPNPLNNMSKGMFG